MSSPVYLSTVSAIGLLADLPAFGIAGRRYNATDTNQEFYDTGTAWIEIVTSSVFGLLVVAFSATPVFDASQAQEFKITLTGNVTAPTFINGTDGPALIAFRIVQDGTGGWTFAWPANVRNGGEINPDANSVSLQLFAVDTDGSLDAVGPMMWT